MPNKSEPVSDLPLVLRHVLQDLTTTLEQTIRTAYSVGRADAPILYLTALTKIAFGFPCDSDQARQMRQVAREALGPLALDVATGRDLDEIAKPLERAPGETDAAFRERAKRGPHA